MKRAAESASPNVKRAHSIKIPTESIFGFFSQAGNWASNIPGSKIILDVRLGVKVGESFTSGIRKDDFDNINRIIERFPRSSPTFVQETDYIYEGASSSVLRIVYDEKLKQCIRSDSKTKLRSYEIQLPDTPYDMRATASQEAILNTPSTIPDNWSRKRDRKLISWKIENLPFKIELTQIKITGQRTEEQMLYELEFVFDDNLISEPKLNPAQVSHDFWEFYIAVATELFRANDSLAFVDLQVQKITNDEEVVELKQAVVGCFSSPLGDVETLLFPGTKPTQFSKKLLPTIQQQRYFVSESAEGIRYMLLIIANNGVYLIDSKFDFYFVPGYATLLDVYPTGVTLLDGEMVRHVGNNKLSFLLTDVLNLNGTVVSSFPLHKRLEKIGEAVQAYRNALQANKISTNHPFSIMGKAFVDKRTMKRLLDCTQVTPFEHFYKDDKRYHKIVGFTFTPDEPYKPFQSFEMLRWNYIQEIYLELKVQHRPNRTGLRFTCVGPDGSEIEYNLSLKNEEKLNRDFSMYFERGHLHIICLFSFDPLSGLWIYKTAKFDRPLPFHFTKVLSTLEAIAENMSVEELAYRISAQEDDWSVQYQKALKSILAPNRQ